MMNSTSRLIRLKKQFFILSVTIFNLALALILAYQTLGTNLMFAFIASCFFTLFLHCMAGYAEKKKSWTFFRNTEITFIILLIISIVLFLFFPFLLLRAQEGP
ncbi:hypothetical protein B9Z55_000636 [Caenorhabditis nigoni]|uniref:Uncharacterized protein n=1 Tax=Caenorhabditis nigoni TaxID=1611254 RepID=A0A2G5VU48_9PELO|nr:hypothetical protein B9Z55_000636 [Caenorhabditis nigoni]